MRVLWVSLVEFPPLSNILGRPIPAHCGWLYASAKSMLALNPTINLGVMVYSYSKCYQEYRDIEGITYYLIPSSKMHKCNKTQINACKKAINKFNPDIIHIHGTEHSLAEASCKANILSIPMIASIQGLAIPYTRYADGGLSCWSKILNITPLDFIRKTFIFNARRIFKLRGKCENYVLNNIDNIIGRTQWDKDHALTINPNLNYHFMNETLRDSFYNESIWSYKHCKRHSIFVSNSGTPLKGAHQVIKALPLILREFPDTTVSFCGSSVMSNKLSSLIKLQGYHLYLRKLVRNLKLQDHVEFLGTLSESQMRQAYIDSNVYVMPSAIENSPNSLCEAQILGVPTVASFVGGVPSLIEDGKTGYLYRYEEFEMLAKIIIRIFRNNDLSSLSKMERDVALTRHDKITNAKQLCSIYNIILNND